MAACLVLVALPAAGACSSKGNSTPTSISPKPIEIVSVMGPMPPFNPGGPNIEITLKNIGTGPIYHLIATLDLGQQTPPIGYVFDFGLTSDTPLAVGDSATLTRTLINAGISNDTFYTLGFDVGVTEPGGPTTYNYSVQVLISSPPPATS